MSSPTSIFTGIFAHGAHIYGIQSDTNLCYPIGMTIVTKLTSAPAQIETNYPAHLLHTARVRAGLSLREAARRGGTSHATLHAYEKGSKSPSIQVFIRLLEACSYAVDITVHPRIRQRNGMPRGDELQQVLDLAEQFPAKHLKNISFPKFERRV